MKNAHAKRMDKLRQYFTVGNKVKSYGGGTDLVIKFEENVQNWFSDWRVTVIEIDSNGNKIGYPRTHCTIPTTIR